MGVNQGLRSERRPRQLSFGRVGLDLVALGGAQALAAVICRRKLIGWPWVPGSILEDLYAVAVFLIIAGAALIAARKSRVYGTVLAAALILATLHCILLGVNVASVQVLGGPLTWQWLVMADYFRGVTPWRSASAAMTLEGALIIALVAVLPAISLLAARWIARSGPPRLHRLAWLGVAAAIVAPPALAQFDLPRPDRAFDMWSSPARVLAQSWLRRPGTLAEDFLPGEPHASYVRQPAGPGLSPQARPDIVLIVLESVGRKNLLDNIARTPAIASLKQRGTWFSEATITVPESSRTVFELSTSHYPVFGLAAETTSLAGERFTTLFEAMERAGYAARFFMSGDFAYDGVGQFLADQGFSGLSDMTDISCSARMDMGERTFWDGLDYIADDCAFRAAGDWMDRQRAPRFLTVWTGQTHYPYTFENSELSRTRQADVEALADSDRALGAFLSRLTRGDRDTIVIVMGDHGEAFGEHGFNVHANSVFEEEIRIPLIISGGPFAAGSERGDLAGAIDIAPTILDLAGVPRPGGWQGQSLVPNGRATRPFAFSFAANREPQIGLRTRDSKYVYEVVSERMVRYDLAADPGELSPQPVTGQKRARVGRLMSSWVRYNRSR